MRVPDWPVSNMVANAVQHMHGGVAKVACPGIMHLMYANIREHV